MLHDLSGVLAEVRALNNTGDAGVVKFASDPRSEDHAWSVPGAADGATQL